MKKEPYDVGIDVGYIQGIQASRIVLCQGKNEHMETGEPQTCEDAFKKQFYEKERCEVCEKLDELLRGAK